MAELGATEVPQLSPEKLQEERVKTVLRQHIQSRPADKQLPPFAKKTMKDPLDAIFADVDRLYMLQQLPEVPNADDSHMTKHINEKPYWFEKNEISNGDWERYYTLSPRMKEIAFGKQGKVTPQDMLAALTFVVDEQLFLEDRLTEAKKMISKHFPSLLPEQPSIVVAHYIPSKKEVAYVSGITEYSSYWGKYGKSHYLTVDVVAEGDLILPKGDVIASPQNNPYKRLNSFDRIAGSLAIAHELFHQKVQEIIDLQRGTPQVDIEQDVSHISANQLIQREQCANQFSEHDTLAAVLNEGLATYFDRELTMINRSVRIFRSGEHERLNIKKLGRMIKAYDWLHGDSASGDLHTIGLDLIHEILESYRQPVEATYGFPLGKVEKSLFPKPLASKLLSIDWVACEQIKKGTEEYEAIWKNPKLIPGLEEKAA